MVHPMKKEGIAGHNDKLRRMTRHYGDANPSMKRNAPVTRAKSEGAEEAVTYGADSSAPNARSDRPARKSKAANPVSTYKKGGKVKHRAAGGRVHKGKTNININVIPQGSMGQGGPGAMAPVLPLGGNPAVPPSMPPPPPQGGIPPQLAAALAGAKPPGMMPPPGMPMRKRGGRVHSDTAEDEALIHKMVKGSALKRARGGKIHMTAGSESGPGRLQKTDARRRNAKHERPQAV